MDETFAVISHNVNNGHSSTFKSPNSNRLEDVNVDEGEPERRFGYRDLDDEIQDDDEPNLVIDFNVRGVELNDGQTDDCSDRNDVARTSSAPVMVAPPSCAEKKIDPEIRLALQTLVNKTFTCHICGGKTSTNSNLIRHYCNVHKLDKSRLSCKGKRVQAHHLLRLFTNFR